MATCCFKISISYLISTYRAESNIWNITIQSYTMVCYYQRFCHQWNATNTLLFINDDIGNCLVEMKTVDRLQCRCCLYITNSQGLFHDFTYILLNQVWSIFIALDLLPLNWLLLPNSPDIFRIPEKIIMECYACQMPISLSITPRWHYEWLYIDWHLIVKTVLGGLPMVNCAVCDPNHLTCVEGGEWVSPGLDNSSQQGRLINAASLTTPHHWSWEAHKKCESFSLHLSDVQLLISLTDNSGYALLQELPVMIWKSRNVLIIAIALFTIYHLKLILANQLAQ